MFDRRVTTLLLFVCGSVAAAQTPGVRFGVTGGVNFAKVQGSGVFDISNHTGALVGAYVAYPLSGGWSFQTGGSFSARGWERDEPGTRDLSVVKLNYIEVPALLRYDFASQQRVGYFGFAGPAFSLRTGCSIDATTHATGVTQSASCDELESRSSGQVAFNSFDWGMLGGAGLRFGFGSANLVATAQYEVGLKQIEKSVDAKSRAASFALGVELPLHLR
jgi:hypothetical protein